MCFWFGIVAWICCGTSAWRVLFLLLWLLPRLLLGFAFSIILLRGVVLGSHVGVCACLLRLALCLGVLFGNQVGVLSPELYGVCLGSQLGVLVVAPLAVAGGTRVGCLFIGVLGVWRREALLGSGCP